MKTLVNVGIIRLFSRVRHRIKKLKIINTTKTLKRQIKHDEKEQNKAGQKKR
jgi:hypothetical protein